MFTNPRDRDVSRCCGCRQSFYDDEEPLDERGRCASCADASAQLDAEDAALIAQDIALEQGRARLLRLLSARLGIVIVARPAARAPVIDVEGVEVPAVRLSRVA